MFDEQENMNGLSMPVVPVRINRQKMSMNKAVESSKPARVAKKATKASRCAKAASSTAGSKVALKAMTGNALVGGHGKPVMSTRESKAEAKVWTALTKWAEKKSAFGTKPADQMFAKWFLRLSHCCRCCCSCRVAVDVAGVA